MPVVLLGALMAALALPLAAALVQRPQRGLLVLAGLVPFDGLLLLRPDLGLLTGWKEALVLVTVAATFVAPAAARAPARRLPGWVPGVAAFVALGLASAVIVGGDRGLYGAKIGFFYLLVAVAAWRCPLAARERDRLVTLLMATGFITAAFGLVQQTMGAERLVELGYAYDETVRFTDGYLRSFSTFIQPFPFGFFLMLVLLIGVPQALDEPRRLRNLLFLATTPVLGLALAVTFVRGAWLGLAVGLTYLALTRYRVLLLAAPLALLGALLLPAGVSTAALSPSSSEERIVGWSENLSRIADAPLGEGIGITGAAGERVEAEGREEAYQPDNYFVKTSIELGVLGVWLLALLLVAALAATHAAARRAPPLPTRDRALASGTAAYVLAAIAASTVSTFFEIFPMEVYFWLLLTVVATMVAPPVTARRALVSTPPSTLPAVSR